MQDFGSFGSFIFRPPPWFPLSLLYTCWEEQKAKKQEKGSKETCNSNAKGP